MAGELRIAKFKHLNPKNGDVFPTAGDVVEPDTLFVYPIGTGIMKTGMSDGSGVFLGAVRQEELFLHDQKDSNGNYTYTEKTPEWYLENFGEGVIVRELVPRSIFDTQTIGAGLGQGNTLYNMFTSGTEFLLMTTIVVRDYHATSLGYESVIQEIHGNNTTIRRRALGFLPITVFDQWQNITPLTTVHASITKEHILSAQVTFTEAEKDTLAAKFGFTRA